MMPYYYKEIKSKKNKFTIIEHKLNSRRIVYKISYKDINNISDYDIARLIGMSIHKYKNWLMKNFHGIKYDNYILFSNFQDAQQALEGINAILLAEELRKINYNFSK